MKKKAKVTIECTQCKNTFHYHEYGTHTVPENPSKTCPRCYSIALRVASCEYIKE